MLRGEAKKAWQKEYNQRPEVKERNRQYQNAWYASHRESCLERKKIYRARRDKSAQYIIDKRGHLRQNHKISLEEFEMLFELQRGLCGICNKKLDKGKDTHVDHNHTTGNIRGLLCNHCNVLLGHAYDSILILTAAINYLGKES